MSYSVREVFSTLQGEGGRAGARSVFVRFTGCNLWDGLPEHRLQGKGACAKWCDTDFARGEKVSTEELLARMDKEWPSPPMEGRWCVLTGGEPLLQLDTDLVAALHKADWRVAIETNGTVLKTDVLHSVDWVCVSPKLGSELKVWGGQELKVVLPGEADGFGWTDEQLLNMEKGGTFERLYVQPMDPIDPRFVQVSFLHPNAGPEWAESQRLTRFYKDNLARCIRFVLKHPTWRLGLQQHKFVDLP